MRPAGVVTIVAILTLAACGGDDGQGAPTPAEPVAPSSTTTAPPGASPVVDWRDPDAALGSGWRLTDCPGDAPLVCVVQDDQVVGALELASYPIESLPAVAEVLREEGERAALDEHVDQFLGDLGADRAAGCPEGYRFEPLEREAVDAADGLAIRYGFTGHNPDGSPSERVVQHAAIRDGAMVVIVAAAYEPDGCLPPEGDGLDVETLLAFEPFLTAAVAASPFPG